MQSIITKDRRQTLVDRAQDNLLAKLATGDTLASIFVLVALDGGRYDMRVSDLVDLSKSAEVFDLLNEQGETIRAARDQIQQLKARIEELEQQVKVDEKA